ncbi:hypothetical protein E2P64_02025 [Candidatus Bathyarchaeota archaeon]|jgi:hypothetical protein|nr:hypothetical protein E2P64_02025 [Candidatus Bathyarchaeota archaeon]
MYCEACRKLHFLDALKHVRQADLQPEIINDSAITSSGNQVQIVPERSGKVSFPIERMNLSETSQKVTRVIASTKNK